MPAFGYASNEGTKGTAWMGRLVLAMAAHLNNKDQNFMC